MAVLMMVAAPASSTAQTVVGEFSIASLNVDGLPPYLSALGIKVDINPEGPQEKYTAVIGQKLMEKGWDIVGLNEDFNYHSTLVNNISGYQVMTHGGKFESSIIAALGILARTWRFSTDGLGLLVKKPMTAYNEERHAWKECYGYMDHDNDSLTKKGFRRYEVELNKDATIDIIVLHADAGAWVQDVSVRVKQMDQLMTFVEKNIKCNHPLVIMGDYNMSYSRDRFQELVIDRLNSNEGMTANDAWRVFTDRGESVSEMIDKIIFVNRSSSEYQLELQTLGNGYDFVREDGTALSDHYPIHASFRVTKKVPTGIDDVTIKASAPRKRIMNGRIVIEKDGRRYGITGEAL